MDWSVNKDIEKVLSMLGLEMPGGDADKLNQLADDWTAMAAAIETQLGALNQAVATCGPADWSGPTADAFHKYWKAQSQAVTDGVANFQKVADSLRTYAKNVDTINNEILSICEQILLATGAGAVLTLVTAGISDAVSAVADSVEAIRIGALVTRFAEMAEQIGVDIERIAEVVAQVMTKLKTLMELFKATKTGAQVVRVGTAVAKAAPSVAANFGKNFVADSLANVGAQALSGQHVTLGADLQNGALDAAGTVGTEGLLGKLGMGTGPLKAGLSNFGGGLVQSEAGGLLGVNGDSQFQLPTNGANVSTDLQNLEGAAADGLGGAAAHDAEVGENAQAFTFTNTLGGLTSGTETSGTSLKQLLDSFSGPGGAMPAPQN